MNFDYIVRIKRSKTRLDILKTILYEAKIPTEIAKALNKYQSSISRSLIALQKDGLVECLTKKGRNFHYYKATKEGINALNFIEKMSGLKNG